MKVNIISSSRIVLLLILLLFFIVCLKNELQEQQKSLGGKLPIYYRIRKNQLDATGIDVYSHYVNSTCFGHHYAHRQENRLCKQQHVEYA